MVIVLVISVLVWCCIWGFVVNSIIGNKGYDESWFIWGFLFGIIAAFVALSKTDMNIYSQLATLSSSHAKQSGGPWTCDCGQLNDADAHVCKMCGKYRSN